MKKIRAKTNDVSYLFQAPTGVQGDITRPDETNAESTMMVSPFPATFGSPVVYASGGVAAWGTSNVAADFAGVLARVAPSISNSIASDASFSGGIPLQTQVQSFVVRGYVNVLCPTGTPARGGVVYIRTVAAGGKAIGDFETISDPGNNVALSATQAEWATDGKDANNNAELRIAR